MILKKIKILFLFFIIIKCEEIIDTSDSINTTTYECQNLNETIDLEIGKEIILCIHIPELEQKIPFKIKVDEYSLLTINQGYSLANKITNKEFIHFIAQIGNITSLYPSVKKILFYFIFSYIYTKMKKLLFLYLILLLKLIKGILQKFFGIINVMDVKMIIALQIKLIILILMIVI